MDAFVNDDEADGAADLQRHVAGGLAQFPITGSETYDRMLAFAQVCECFVHLATTWVVERDAEVESEGSSKSS